MKKIVQNLLSTGLLTLSAFGTANASLITVEHNITNLPSSGYFSIDLDDDGINDINLASNFYVSVFNYSTNFVRSYSLIGDVIDANTTIWWSGNWWPSSSGYVQDGLLYLGVRDTSIGDYYGYMTFNYDSDSNSVSLNSYTYENSGSAITVGASVVPVPAAVWLFGSGLLGLMGFAKRKSV